MRFKVGDRVRIKSLDWYNENKDKFGNVDCGFQQFTYEMSKFCGQTMIITDISRLDVITMGMSVYYWTDEMIEGLVEEETKFGTASNPIEIKSNANCLTRERVDALAIKIDEELPFGNPYEWECPEGYQFIDENGNVINATKIFLEKKSPKTNNIIYKGALLYFPFIVIILNNYLLKSFFICIFAPLIILKFKSHE